MNNNPFMPGAQTAPTAPTGPAMPGNTRADTTAFEVDLSDVQVSKFSIPDGTYKVKCLEVEQQVSKSGNPMFVWTFEVSDGPHAGFQSKVFTAVTPAAMWKVAETVIALGVGQQGQVVKFRRSDVIGKECGALIEATEYNGNTRSQIFRVMSLQEMAEATK